MTSKLYNFDGSFIKDTDYVRKNFTGISVDFYGAKSYYKKGKIHRTDGPAIDNANGGKEWYFKGKLHRIDGPAVEWASGYKAWYIDDKRHRLDGPAVEYIGGTKEWYVYGQVVTEEQHGLLTDIMKLKGLK